MLTAAVLMVAVEKKGLQLNPSNIRMKSKRKKKKRREETVWPSNIGNNGCERMTDGWGEKGGILGIVLQNPCIPIYFLFRLNGRFFLISYSKSELQFEWPLVRIYVRQYSAWLSLNHWVSETKKKWVSLFFQISICSFCSAIGFNVEIRLSYNVTWMNMKMREKERVFRK